MKKAIILGLFAVVASAAQAQYFDKMYFVNWAGNQPLSNTDYAGKFSARGARLGYRELINEKFAGGIDLSWATYDDYIGRQTYQTRNGALTTDFFKYVESYQGTVVFDYYFFSERKLMPYVGIGLGAGYYNFKMYYNVFSTASGEWGFLTRPQAGAWLRLSERKPWALHVSAYFDFATASSEDYGYDNFSNIGLQIGLVHLDW